MKPIDGTIFQAARILSPTDNRHKHVEMSCALQTQTTPCAMVVGGEKYTYKHHRNSSCGHPRYQDQRVFIM